MFRRTWEWRMSSWKPLRRYRLARESAKCRPSNEPYLFQIQIQEISSYCILVRYRQWDVPAAPAHSGNVKDKSKKLKISQRPFLNVYFRTGEGKKLIFTFWPKLYDSSGEAFKLPLDNAIGFHTNAAEFLFQPEVVKDRQDQNEDGDDKKYRE